MDWRSGLSSEARNRIVKIIMDELQKQHNPPDGRKLLKIACLLEEKFYMTATDQQDYLRRISLKILSLETKSSQNNGGNAPSPNPTDASQMVSGTSSLAQQPSLMQQQQQQQPYMQQQPSAQALHQQQLLSNGQQMLQQQMAQPKQQQALPQQNQPLGRRAVSKTYSASVDSGQTAQSASIDQQERNKLRTLKDKYLPDMNDLRNMLGARSQQPMPADQLQKLNGVLSRMISYLSTSRTNLPKEFRLDKLEAFEKEIVSIMGTFKKRRLPQQQHLPPVTISEQWNKKRIRTKYQ